MTFADFCAALRKTDGWQLTTVRLADGKRLIQIRRGPHCPLSYVGQGPPCSVNAPKGKLGLDADTARHIVNASDGWLPTPVDADYRDQLFRACRLVGP